jgi:hypothetical protein
METYEVLFSEGETTGVYGISLVNEPAMEAMWIALSNETQVELKSVDTEKRIVCGAVLIPNKIIPRKGFNITFPNETVLLASQSFLKNGYQKNSTLEHEQANKLTGVSVIESWIKEDETNDKSVMYGFNDPIGTWYASMKIDNNEVWNDYIKSGKVKGFSIDGFFDMKQINLKKENMITEILEAIKDGFTSLKKEEVKIELGSVMTADGSTKVNFEGDTVKVGLPMTVTDGEGTELPLPDGEYQLEGGVTATIVGGLVEELTEAQAEASEDEAVQTPMSETAPTAPQVKSEKVTSEVFYQLSKEDFNKMVLELSNAFDSKINALKVELSEVKKEEAVELTKTKPAKEKSWEQMTALERFRASKN